MDDRTRVRTFHLLLDLVSSWDPEASDEVNGRALKVVAEDLTAIRAVRATFDAEARRVDLDLGGLLGAATGLAHHLAAQLAEERGTSLHDELVAAREHLDG